MRMKILTALGVLVLKTLMKTISSRKRTTLKAH